MKDTYQFSCHADYWRRFGSTAEPVGETERGNTVWAWRGGLWKIYEVCGATVQYTAKRVSVTEIARADGSKAALEVLQGVADAMAV